MKINSNNETQNTQKAKPEKEQFWENVKEKKSHVEQALNNFFNPVIDKIDEIVDNVTVILENNDIALEDIDHEFKVDNFKVEVDTTKVEYNKSSQYDKSVTNKNFKTKRRTSTNEKNYSIDLKQTQTKKIDEKTNLNKTLESQTSAKEVIKTDKGDVVNQPKDVVFSIKDLNHYQIKNRGQVSNLNLNVDNLKIDENNVSATTSFGSDITTNLLGNSNTIVYSKVGTTETFNINFRYKDNISQTTSMSNKTFAELGVRTKQILPINKTYAVLNAFAASNLTYTNLMNDKGTFDNKFDYKNTASADFTYSPNKYIDLALSGSISYTLSTDVDSYTMGIGFGAKIRPFDDETQISLKTQYELSDKVDSKSDKDLNNKIKIDLGIDLNSRLGIGMSQDIHFDKNSENKFKLDSVKIGGTYRF